MAIDILLARATFDNLSDAARAAVRHPYFINAVADEIESGRGFTDACNTVGEWLAPECGEDGLDLMSEHDAWCDAWGEFARLGLYVAAARAWDCRVAVRAH
jgi:selenocysteine lyase/cysteine desulfurase